MNLPAISWVHRPPALDDVIDEATDLCPACCEKRVSRYREEYPEHASDIIAGGGWEACRQSESLPTCDECGCDLACYLMDTFYDVADWDDHDRCIDTTESLARANKRLDDASRNEEVE